MLCALSVSYSAALFLMTPEKISHSFWLVAEWLAHLRPCRANGVANWRVLSNPREIVD